MSLYGSPFDLVAVIADVNLIGLAAGDGRDERLVGIAVGVGERADVQAVGGGEFHEGAGARMQDVERLVTGGLDVLRVVGVGVDQPPPSPCAAP